MGKTYLFRARVVLVIAYLVYIISRILFIATMFAFPFRMITFERFFWSALFLLPILYLTKMAIRKVDDLELNVINRYFNH